MRKTISMVLACVMALMLGCLALAGCTGKDMSKSPYLGKWTATEASLSGITLSVEAVIGGEWTLDLQKDGTVVMNVAGEEQKGKWDETSLGFKVEDEIDVKVKDGVGVCEYDGVTITFVQEGATPINPNEPAEEPEASDPSAVGNGEAIIVDCSEQVYDARTASDVDPTELVGELPDGWTMSAEIVDSNDAECIVLNWKNPNGTTFTKPFENIGFDEGPKLLTFWGTAADAYNGSPTFIITIGTDENDAKTYVMSYVEDKGNMLFWTTDGAELNQPSKVTALEGQAIDFDGTILTVGDKQYTLGENMTITE